MAATCVLCAVLFPYFRDLCQLDNSYRSMAVLFSFIFFSSFLRCFSSSTRQNTIASSVNWIYDNEWVSNGIPASTYFIHFIHPILPCSYVIFLPGSGVTMENK